MMVTTVTVMPMAVVGHSTTDDVLGDNDDDNCIAICLLFCCLSCGLQKCYLYQMIEKCCFIYLETAIEKIQKIIFCHFRHLKKIRMNCKANDISRNPCIIVHYTHSLTDVDDDFLNLIFVCFVFLSSYFIIC